MSKARKAQADRSGVDEFPGSAPPRKTEVRITPANGRAMLTWVGKRPLSFVTAFPAQHIETFEPVGAGIARPGAQQAAPLREKRASK
jgi:hypothetical protein